jgi:hypothetical protein
MKLWGILLGISVFLCCGALVPALLFPVEFALWLAIGWAPFLYRVLPEMTVNWGGLATAVACLAGLAAALHSFCGWLYGQILRAKYPDRAAEKRWQPRWTAGLLAVVILMFVAGIAAVGLTHQTVWLAIAPEPLMEIKSVRELSAKSQSINNLRQIGLAVHNYESSFKKLPPGTLFDAQGRALHGWQTMILPYLEHEKIFNQINRNLPWHHPENRLPFQRFVPAYMNPGADQQTSPEGYALSHYAGNVHVWRTDVPLQLQTDFPDGASNTILAGEAQANFKPWGHPANWRDPGLGINTTPDGFGNPRHGAAVNALSRRFEDEGAHFVMGDASVRFISDKVSPEILKALAMPKGRPKIPDNWDER